jgi:SAM-dependent methyltransferase
LANAFVGQYAVALSRHGGLRGALRRYGLVRLVDMVLRTAWEALGMQVLHFLGRRPSRGYGWLDAFLSPTCYYWFRYAEVISALERLAPPAESRLIEVASGGRGGIAWALGRQDSGICLVDRSADLLRDARGRGALRVCADGTCLPFQDNAFDAAVSLDTVEHLPRTARPIFIEELKRVVKHGIVITCPLVSADGLFEARKPDMHLSAAIAKRDGVQPGWLEEHLQQGHPTREELLEVLPGAQVTGSDNCEAWLRFALLQQRLFMWLFSGVFYLLFLRRQDTETPYRQALLVWQKPTVAPKPIWSGGERVLLAKSNPSEFAARASQVTSTR